MQDALVGAFAPGAAPLSERLHTLRVTPAERVSPGELVRVSLMVSNRGMAAAKNVRVRFLEPAAAPHVDGSDRLDRRPIAGANLSAPAGVLLGDLAAGAEHDLACAFRVRDRLEDRAVLQFQAAVCSGEIAPFGSNVVRLIVRSAPDLHEDRAIVRRLEPSESATPFVEFPAASLLRALRALESEGTSGLRRHLMVLRALVLNVHAPVARVLENARDRAILSAMLRQALDPHEPRRHEPGQGIVRLSGVVEVAALREREPRLASAPLGAATSWIVAAQLLGTRIELDSRQMYSEELARYRDDLLEALEVLETLPVREFWRAVDSAVNRPLDEALGRAIDTLRAAAL